MVSDKKKFALIGHPLDMEQYRAYIKFLKPNRDYKDKLLMKLFEWAPSYKVKEWNDYSIGLAGTADGIMIMVPFLPEMRDIKLNKVMEKIENALEIAANENVSVAALGAFTSILCQGREEELSLKYGVEITSGNTNTTALICYSIDQLTKRWNLNLEETSLAIIGASGDIGSGCIQYFGNRVKCLKLSARGIQGIQEVVGSASEKISSRVSLFQDNFEAIQGANIVICATSAYTEIFSIQDFEPGTIVCDASAPLNVNPENYSSRKDIFLYHGGIASLKNTIDLGFDVGLASTRNLYGCMTEGILLAIKEDLPVSAGRGNITLEKINSYLDIYRQNNGPGCAYSVGSHLYNEIELEQFQTAIMENSV